MALRLYTNESIHVAVAAGLQQRAVDSWSARDAGNLGLTDEEQLAYAIREHAAIFTHDADFLRIAHEWAQQGNDHWGIFYVHEQKLSLGEHIRRLAQYALIAEADDMKNRVEFL